MRKVRGLRQRWLINTVGVIFALGMVCVMAVTAIFAVHYYSDMDADLKMQASTASRFFSECLDREQDDFLISCREFVARYAGDEPMEVQFLDASGLILAASSETGVGTSPNTSEIQEAISTRGPRSYLGQDPATGRHIMAASCPVIYSDGQVVGVFRFVAPTRSITQQILLVFGICFGVLLVILAVVSVTGGYYLQSVMIPVEQITEKAKRIANGSYGIQIQTKYNDEIGVLAETINEMSAKISQNEKMQADFISQLSHELRTPLTVINGWTETLLLDEGMDPMTRQGMKIISGEAKRLTEMVMELLDFTRMQDGRMFLTVEETDIREEFEDTVYMYGSRLSQDGIKLHYDDNGEDIPTIPCDPKRMRQVFLNILDNAAKHGGEGKRVDVSMHYENECVVVRFRDYGPGIPEDEIPLVKKKFYKGSSKARGTGIGLAVCDEIVELHGGTLTLENAPGGGTLVTVTLPSAQ